MRVLRAAAACERQPQRQASKKQTAKRTPSTRSAYKNMALRSNLPRSSRQQERTTAGTANTNRPLHKTRNKNVPKNPTASGSEIAAYLCSLQIKDGPAVFSRAISFTNNIERKGWNASMPDAKDRATISEFLRSPLLGRRGRLGLISCPTDNWVRQKEKPTGDQGTWSDMWHVSAVALLPGKQPGKHMVVWDCDPYMPETGRTISQCRAKEVLRGIQRSLWEEIRKRTSMNCHLWYNTVTSHSGQRKCLQIAARVIKNWASIADKPLDGPHDPRVKGCVPVSAL